MADIFDRMAARRARALVQQQHPVGWKLNDAAFAALRHDGVIDDADAAGPIEQIRIFGLPVLLDHDDQSGEPQFTLLLVDLSSKTGVER